MVGKPKKADYLVQSGTQKFKFVSIQLVLQKQGFFEKFGYTQHTHRLNFFISMVTLDI